MEDCGFQSQLLSVMEVLAKAAVAEINRRVDDSCAVLRLEVTQSRRDIDLLKRRSEVMEAELRRSRMRARRKVFYPPAAERFSPLVKVVLNKGRLSSGWDAEAPNQPQECADVEPANEAEHILIKEECAEEDMWKNDSGDKLISEAEQPPCFDASQPAQTDSFVERYHCAENAADLGSLVSSTHGYNTLPEHQQQQQQHRNQTDAQLVVKHENAANLGSLVSYKTLPEQQQQQHHRDQTEAELVVKHENEEEPDENAAPLDSADKLVTEEGDEQLWSSNMCRDAVDPSFSYAEQQFEPIPCVFPSQSGLHLEDMVPRIHSVGKSYSVMASSARVKRRARAFGCKRPQPDEGHSALSQINTMDQGSIPQQSQHQFTDSPQGTNPGEDLPPPNLAPSPFCRSSFGLARRMRTPWRSGIGEKRFSCTYCDKSFMRFSQLKEHLRSHTGEKPFSCLQCGRSFTKQCNLIRHAVVHSGEKPYECSLCGKCFTQRSSLKSHQKTAH